MYATTGDHFTYGSRITWSIVPDGTNIAGTPSNLISTLNNQLGQGNWLPAFQDAFAEWENYANVNLAQVSDNGAAINSGNLQQGSSSFGDIRIGGYVQSNNVLAFTLLPPTANGGSDAGDMFFNTGQPWHINSDYDLETVAFHEIGHALGLGHSASPNAAMYPYYEGIDQGPSSDDVAGVQAIWGARQEDPFVQQNGNLSFNSAVNVTSFMTQSNNQVYLPGLNVASSSETYWYKVTTPSNANNVFTALVQSTYLSELSPKVSVYSASNKGMASTAASANSYGTVVSATIYNATPNTTYYVKVQGSNSGDTGTGAYALTINMGSGSIGVASPPNTAVAIQTDQASGGMYDQIGGANTAANTPTDLPDPFAIGGAVAGGDALVINPNHVKFTKHLPTHLKIAHPTHRPKVKASKAASQSHHSD